MGHPSRTLGCDYESMAVAFALQANLDKTEVQPSLPLSVAIGTSKVLRKESERSRCSA
jgi:hypothetical protein